MVSSCGQRRHIRLGRCPGWSESLLGAQSLRWFCHVPAQMSQITRKGTRVLCGLCSFKRACAAFQRGQISGSLSEASSTRFYCVCKQQRLWRDCPDVQALVGLHWCAGSPEPSPVAYVISILFTWAGSNDQQDTCKYSANSTFRYLYFIKSIVFVYTCIRNFG